MKGGGVVEAVASECNEVIHRDRRRLLEQVDGDLAVRSGEDGLVVDTIFEEKRRRFGVDTCLLYTSDAADE